MSEINSEATQTDESQVSDFDFDAMADEVLGLEPDTATQDAEEATEELEGADPHADEDAEEVDEVNEGEEDEEVEAEDDDEESATQEDDTDELEDGEIDMGFVVPVKIDGEESEVTMEELVANYQTKQHQSKKGDELAKQASQLKQLEADSMVVVQINAELIDNEKQKDLVILGRLKEEVDTAYDEDDYDASKLNRKLDKAKEEYAKRQDKRDNILATMGRKVQEQHAQSFNQQVEHFNKEIPNYIPEWSETRAKETRSFALEQGLSSELLDSITDPLVVKLIDEFRVLKSSATKGAVKRKKAPVKRAPTRKPVSKSTKKSNKVEASRQRINKGKGSENDDKVVFDNIIDSMFE